MRTYIHGRGFSRRENGRARLICSRRRRSNGGHDAGDGPGARGADAGPDAETRFGTVGVFVPVAASLLFVRFGGGSDASEETVEVDGGSPSGWDPRRRPVACRPTTITDRTGAHLRPTMRRRAFLRRSGALAGLGALPARPAAGAADAQGTSTPTFTPRQTTPTAEGTEVLARLPVERLKEAVTAPDGATAYCATTDGFAVVDISDPADPSLLVDERDPLADRDPTLFDVYDVKLDHENDLLAVVGPANPVGSGVFKGLIVYDVSDPATPERVTVHGTEFFNHNCFAADGRVYLCGNTGDRNGVVIVDARSGEELGRWSLADRNGQWRDVRLRNWVLHDLTVHDGVAYLAHWDAGTVLLDVSDPSSPTFLARIGGRSPAELAAFTGDESRTAATEPPGNHHHAATDGDGLLGVGVESWDVTPDDDDGGGPGAITLYDASDPGAPEELAVIDPPPTPDPTLGGVPTTSHNFEFRGDRLYTSWYRGGVRVYDVRDPVEPELLARWRDSHGTAFWNAEPATDGAFVAPSWKGRDDDGGFVLDAAALYTFRDPGPPADGTTTATDGQSGLGPLAGVSGLAGAGLAARRLLGRDDGG